MVQPGKTNRFLSIALVCMLLTLATPPQPVRAAGICVLSAGQVVINEILPNPTDGVEWVELYNTTDAALDISNCYIDDIPAGGSAPIQIPAGNAIPAHGFWTLDHSGGYFNNTGDDVRLLLDDSVTVLDSYTYRSSASGVSWYRNPDGGPWALVATSDPTKGASNSDIGVCGTGSWTAGNLEIHHIDVGQADSTLIVSPTGKSLLFDAGESSWTSSEKARVIGPYVKSVLGCKKLDYVVISHFHVDHIGYVGNGGLWHLVEAQNFTVGQTLLRNYTTYLGETSGTFDNWKTYLAGSGQGKLHPVTAVEGAGQVSLGGGVSFKIVTANGNGALIPGNFSADTTPPSENDYSIGALISYGAFDEWLGGDLDGEYASEFDYRYHDIELSVAPEVGDVDVYRVNHHGSDHSNSPTFLGQLDPEVSIVSVGDSNPYGHPRQAVMDALLATSDVYLTERGDPTTNIGAAVVAGNVVVKTSNGVNYTVNGTNYIANEPTRTDADGDGYFAEVDPGDANPNLKPAPRGGCDALYQICANPRTPTVMPTRTRTATPRPTSTRTRTPTATATKVPTTVRLMSVGAADGWVLESSEISNIGGAFNASAATFNLGDNAAKKQYRGILSFNTGASLPDNAVITGVTLKAKKSAIVGDGNPVTAFGGFMVDIKNGFFGTAALQATDFQAAASKSYGPFNTVLVGGWYSINLTAAGPFVNKLATASGLTQIRLRFTLDDNNNTVANYLSLYSGNPSTGSGQAALAADRPQLVITYYMP
jgi:beta-lactamase superfamily II metal-dependent hydrolase